VLLAAALLAGLGAVGWLAFAYGTAGLVLRSGDCAGRAAVDLLLLGGLVAIVAACAAPPILLVRGRGRLALRALGIGTAGVVVFYTLAFAGVSTACS